MLFDVLVIACATLAVDDIGSRRCEHPAPRLVRAWRTEDGGNGHRYWVVVSPDGISWSRAAYTAELLGGHLVTLESPEENAFVFSMVVGLDEAWTPHVLDDGRVFQHGPWIGLRQDDNAPEPAGGWRWVDGGSLANPLWSPHEPNNRQHPEGKESRAHYFGWGEVRTPFWNDMPETPGGTGGEPGMRVTAFVVEFPLKG